MDRFKEIEESSSNGIAKTKFVCGPHKNDFCANCQMDFQLLNNLRYDPAYPSCSSDITGYLTSSTAAFYRRSDRRVAPGLNANPRLPALLKSFTSTGVASLPLKDMIECFAYTTFTTHGAPFMQERIISILESLLKTFKMSDHDSELKSRQTIYEEYKNHEKQVKTRRKASGNIGGLKARTEKAIEMIQSSTLKIQYILEKNNIAELGRFFVDLAKAVEAMTELQEGLDDENAKIATAVKNAVDGKVHLPQDIDMLKSLTRMQIWMDFISAQVEETMRVDDPGKWDKKDIIKLLNHHNMKLVPFPKRNILDSIARELIRFRIACGQIIETTPDECELEALGRQSMGVANDVDETIIAKMYAPAKIADFMIEPQILPNFSLDGLSRLNYPDVDNLFAFKRTQHAERFYQKTFHQVLEYVDNVAETWDRIQKTGKDRVEKFDANEGTGNSKNLAIRPIELWSFMRPNELRSSIPLLGVEYIHAVERNSGPESILHFSQGLRKETTYLRNTCDEEVMDMFVSLLEGNRHQLNRDDATFKNFKKNIPKGWKFSVLCPVDPTKRSGIMMCPGCGKVATKTCSRCKMVAYCSRECQAAQWKSHKKICKPLSGKK